MNGIRLCTCGHQDIYHHPRLGLCESGAGGLDACPCTGFVLAGGSTTPRPSITEQERREAAAAVLDQMLADALDEYEEDVTEAQIIRARAQQVERLRSGTWTSTDLTPESRHVARQIAAAERRAFVLHPMVEAEKTARVVDALLYPVEIPTDGTYGDPGSSYHPFPAREVTEYLQRPPCYGCGHPWDMHEEGAFGRGLACKCVTAWFQHEGDAVPARPEHCPCPVYVETPPVDACGRCGHAKRLHDVFPETRPLVHVCHGTGVDVDGNERARARACRSYVPEQPPEVEPVDRLCLCGHPESAHGPLGTTSILRACQVEDGTEYADSCIEFRPATITEVLPNGVILEHTPYADRDLR